MEFKELIPQIKKKFLSIIKKWQLWGKKNLYLLIILFCDIEKPISTKILSNLNFINKNFIFGKKYF